MEKEITELIQNGKDALVVGGSNGVGLAVAHILSRYCRVWIVDKVSPALCLPANVKFIPFDLTEQNFSLFEELQLVDKLIITAGFGRLALFKDCNEKLLIDMMAVNATAVMRVIWHFYSRMLSTDNFYCSVMGSIAGFMSSPFFAVYGASKAALKIFIESLNVELLKSGTDNRILNVSPGSLKGTAFNGLENDLSQVIPFAEELIKRMMKREDLFIPQYEEVYRQVLERYAADFRAEGIHSYEYKQNSDRLRTK